MMYLQGVGQRVNEQVRGDARVAGDPADVSHASEAVVGVDVEYVFNGEGSAKEVPRRGVDDTLGLSGRARGLKKDIKDIHQDTRRTPT